MTDPDEFRRWIAAWLEVNRMMRDAIAEQMKAQA